MKLLLIQYEYSSLCVYKYSWPLLPATRCLLSFATFFRCRHEQKFWNSVTKVFCSLFNYSCSSLDSLIEEKKINTLWDRIV